MTRLFCIAAALTLLGTPAFGQSQQGVFMFAPLGTQVYLREGKGAGADATGFFDMVTRAIDRSRILHLVPSTGGGDKTMEIEAPITFVKTADGLRVTVTYEVTASTGQAGQMYSASCAATQLDRCAQDIAQRAERLGRRGSNDGL